jgi:hypothetical protein
MFRSSADHHQGAYLILVKIIQLKFESSCMVNLVMWQHTFICFTCCLVWRGMFYNYTPSGTMYHFLDRHSTYFTALQAIVLIRVQFRRFLQRYCTYLLQDILLVVQNFTGAFRSRMYASIRKSSELFLSFFLYAVTL